MKAITQQKHINTKKHPFSTEILHKRNKKVLYLLRY
jgi:hypothetical protein